MSTEVKLEFQAKAIPFRRFGSSGLRVPLLSLGGWLTIGGTVNGDPAKDIIKTAFEHGINMFDTAEEYTHGESEKEIGRIIKELGLRRTDLVISTKLFWGVRKGPNAWGLSRKHIIEGTKESLERLQLDYVDIIYAHRPDNTVPMEEVVRAFNFVIEKGWAFYWATSEWSALEIEEAHHVSSRLGLIAPLADQCQYHMFHRERAEKEYHPLYKKYQYSNVAYSPLARGMLTGKVFITIPEGSRFATNKSFDRLVKELQQPKGQEEIRKVRELTKLAKEEFDATPGALAIAFLAMNPNTATVLMGCSSKEQLLENIKAIDILPRFTPEIMEKVENILDNKPTPVGSGRPPLDAYGRP